MADSPNTLNTRPDPSTGYSAIQIRKSVLGVLALFGMVIVMIIVYVIATKGQSAQASTEQTDTQPTLYSTNEKGADMQSIMDSAPRQAVIDPPAPVTTNPPPPPTTPPPISPVARAAEEAWIAEQKLKQQRLQEAMQASTGIQYQEPAKPPSDNRLAAARQQVDDYQQAFQQTLPVSTSMNQPLEQGSQADKQAFLEKSRRHSYLTEGRQAPLSPYELKIGTVIPASLISAINSDTPGNIIAQISQTVYDSSTGATPLLPQGARLFGTYDSRVAFGQERLPVVWTRINFPDGSTLDLEGMSGVDVTGKAGLTGKVNHHYWRIFGHATLLGGISGITQAGVSDGNSDTHTTSESVADGIVQQYAETGNQLIRKNMNIQPTIDIDNGDEFFIMLTKDVILPPYSEL